MMLIELGLKYIFVMRTKKDVDDIGKGGDKMDFQKREKSCGAIIFRKEKGEIELLLLRLIDASHWSFPKGHVEYEETEIETALREIKEETGHDVKLIPGFREAIEYPICDNTILKQVVYFLAEVEPGETVIQESEVEKFCWVDPKMARTMIYDDNLPFFDKAMEFLGADLKEKEGINNE